MDSKTWSAAERLTDKKAPVVRTRSVASSETETETQTETETEIETEGAQPPSQLNSHGRKPRAYRPTIRERVVDIVRVSMAFGRTMVKERGSHYQPLSDKGRWVHNLAEPLFGWWGLNTRLLTTACRSSVRIATFPKDGLAEPDSTSTVVNGASHNYAGFYAPTEHSEQLHRACLDLLPLADERVVPALTKAARDAIARHFDADFAYCTNTGYGSNYVALPAIIGALVQEKSGGVAVILDDKCHNSMFTGTFLAQPACVRKFRHNDVEHLKELLGEVSKYEQVLVCIEGLYSMEGAVPCLGDMHRLKSKHGFVLYCDEAHSFLCIGRTGRGCIEFWNEEHPDDPVPTDLFDIRTATLSKAIGGLGGLICGDARFAQPVSDRLAELYRDGSETTLSYTLLQTVWALSQPLLVERNLRRLSEISRFCRDELTRYGLRVDGDRGTPVLPVVTGAPTVASRLSYEMRLRGLLATPVTIPAVTYWEGRVRVNLSAEHSDHEVNALVDAVLGAARACGVCDKKHFNNTQRREFRFSAAGDSAESKLVDIDAQADEAHRAISELIAQAVIEARDDERASESKSLFDSKCDASVLLAGHQSRAMYGVGSGGSRWICGTFPTHLAAEAMLCRATGTEGALTYPDTAIGLSSTVAALCRPLRGFRRHVLLVPVAGGASSARSSFDDGLVIAPRTGAPQVSRYDGLDELCSTLRGFGRGSSSSLCCSFPGSGRGIGRGKTYATVCMDVQDDADVALLPETLDRLRDSVPDDGGLTVLLNAPRHLLRLADLRIGKAGRPNSKPGSFEILVCGSLYKTFGIPGGYLVGGAVLLQELRYWSRGYMFTTSPPPFVMAMARRALELEMEGR